VHERGRGIFNSDGTVACLDGAIFDTTERKCLDDRLEHLAYHDPLTGLPNRAMFREHVEVAIARCSRYGGTLAVLFIDLDEFKLVNDSFGHSVGDLLLCDVARRVRGVARATDVVARQGGDEFMVLILGAPEPSRDSSATLAASRLADRLRDALAEPLAESEIDVPLGASIGIALYPDHAATADD
jgi:diguanylate cyclase (GGDEF)-like protein